VGLSPLQSSASPASPPVSYYTASALRFSYTSSSAFRTAFIRATRAVTRLPGFRALSTPFVLSLRSISLSLVQADIVVAIVLVSYLSLIVSSRLVLPPSLHPRIPSLERDPPRNSCPRTHLTMLCTSPIIFGCYAALPDMRTTVLLRTATMRRGFELPVAEGHHSHKHGPQWSARTMFEGKAKERQGGEVKLHKLLIANACFESGSS
jgi:hypothetical protein